MTRAAEAEIKGAKKEAEALRSELDRASRAAREREAAHAAELKRREAAFEARAEKAKKEARRTVERVSGSATADLAAARDREKKLEAALRRAEAKADRQNRQTDSTKKFFDERSGGSGSTNDAEFPSAAGSRPSDADDGESAARAAELDRLRLELEELRAVHAADLEKRGGALRATREQLQETSREVASLRATREALQDAVSLAVASGASEEEVAEAMRKRGVSVERTRAGLSVTTRETEA